jgi:2-keto-4-pentenoate hydratase/2-oxohepta-3-ene-1,7-dioic acid hydratase in catechol pathway
MKIASFELCGAPTYGVVTKNGARPVTGDYLSRFSDLRSALAESSLPEISAATKESAACPLEELKFLPPIPNPAKIFCVGMNYLAHIKEMGRQPPAFPALFVRHADSLVAHDQKIIRPRVSSDYDFEGELAIIIGRPARYVKADQASGFVAGYSCFMDGSIRDYQRQTSQFTAGKNFPGSGAFGPWIVTSDEVPDPQVLHLQTRVNGEVMQRGDIADLCFGVFELVEYISTITRLLPGDVIATGTPSGVGAARKPPRWLESGDTVEVELDGVGILRNQVTEESRTELKVRTPDLA